MTSSEREVLEQLQRRLAAADVDAAGLVEEAWAQARDDVRATLQRLMTHDLLERCLRQLDDAAPPDGGAEPERSAADVSGARSVPVAPTAPDEAGAAAEFVAADEPEEERDPEHRPPHPADQRRTYVYGIADATLAVPSSVPGMVGGGAPRLLTQDGVTALVCDVDPATFEVLREPGPDGLETLASAAHAHDATLATVAAQHTVLPLPLGTVVLDDEAVLRLLAAHREQLRAELERLAGLSEWAVTVQLLQDPGAPEEPPADEAMSGRDYLRARQEARTARESRWEVRDRIARELHETLAATASAADTVGSRPVEEVAPPLLHGVYLIPETGLSRFHATVEHLRSRYHEAIIEVTGPWPAYHFTSVRLDGGTT